MNLQEAITELRAICIEEAVVCEIPPAVIEVLLIRSLFKAKKRRYLIPEFLQSGALCRLLLGWNGPFKVLINRTEPTIKFADEKIIGESFDHLNPAVFRWDRMISVFNLEITPYQRDTISERLLEKAIAILSVSYV